METDGTEIHQPPLNPEAVAIRINSDRCSGCGRCVSACHKGLFTLDQQGSRKKARLLDPGRCDLCRKCMVECLLEAISETLAT